VRLSCKLCVRAAVGCSCCCVACVASVTLSVRAIVARVAVDSPAVDACRQVQVRCSWSSSAHLGVRVPLRLREPACCGAFTGAELLPVKPVEGVAALLAAPLLSGCVLCWCCEFGLVCLCVVVRCALDAELSRAVLCVFLVAVALPSELRCIAWLPCVLVRFPKTVCCCPGEGFSQDCSALVSAVAMLPQGLRCAASVGLASAFLRVFPERCLGGSGGGCPRTCLCCFCSSACCNVFSDGLVSCFQVFSAAPEDSVCPRGASVLLRFLRLACSRRWWSGCALLRPSGGVIPP
ncbi:hypothetical protein Taro_033242, partial [Colocasia esculenta]|nr:hypothetical protein [Colocasia esculenta]